MDSQKTQNTSRIIVYVVLMGLVAVAIAFKIIQIKNKNSSSVVSTAAIQELNGIPVEVERVAKKNFSIFIKATGEFKGPKDIVAKVTRVQQRKIRPGMQVIFLEDSRPVYGRVVVSDADPDLNSGMCNVGIVFEKSFPSYIGKQFALDIETMTIASVFSVPIASVFKEDGNDKVWIIENNHAKKKVIYTEQSSEERIIVKGVDRGDLVVTAGMNNMKENQKVYISKCEGCINEEKSLRDQIK